MAGKRRVVFPVKFVERAMELLGAGLGVDGKQDAGVASVLGGEVVALDFELARDDRS